MSVNHNHLVIMAGGVGSRFWPMSTPERPKQFVDVLGTGRSLIQMTLDRFRGVVDAQNVWVVTSRTYENTVRQQLPEVPADNVLLEPCRRNTAPCIAYAAWRIKARDPKANMVVAPSDHVVTDTEEFRRVIADALSFTAGSDAVVTLGMKPTRPETGYGYIKADLSSPSLRNKGIFRVDSFKEKPDAATAAQYIRRKEYFWNSGIFVWNVNTIVNALRIFTPEISMIFERLLPVYGTPEEQSRIDEEFPNCTNISIDYAVLEKADEIFVMPASFGWSDLGTWGSLITLMDKDAQGNAVVGNDVRLYDTSGCMIHTTEERRVVIQGLKNCIVAEKDNTLLICQLSEEQRIREFSEE